MTSLCWGLIAIALVVPACSSAATTTEGDGTTATSAQTIATAGTGDIGVAGGSTTGSSTKATDDYTATETSYTSAGTSISISTVSSGNGEDKVTYYVADVQLSKGTDLESAFSNGEYGAKALDTSTIAAANDAIIAINGDYYSTREDGIVIRNGVVYRDVPARTGLALYKDGTMAVYSESETTAEQLLAEGVWNTFSFGPALLVDGEIADGLDTYEADPNTRHPIQGTNPRTGVGIIEANHFVFVVVDGRSPGYSRGVTLEEFAQIFASLGCDTAYNLDGGGSSTLYFLGSVVNDPSQKNGERSVSDILFVG